MELCTIPFPCDNYEQADILRRQMIAADIFHDTRGDRVEIDTENEQLYLVVKTGNIRGMIADLEEEGFL